MKQTCIIKCYFCILYHDFMEKFMKNVLKIISVMVYTEMGNVILLHRKLNSFDANKHENSLFQNFSPTSCNIM